MNRRRFLTLSAAFACAPRLAEAATWRGTALGAEVSVTLTGPRDRTAPLLASIPGLLAGIESDFSLYDPTSALSLLNETGRLDRPGRAFRDLLAACDRAHVLTGGLFDPTVQPLWRALAEGRDTAAARALIGWNRVRHDDRRVTAGPGQQMTFNGIAQGFATDTVARFLEARGLETALIDIGEQRALGGPFTLGLEDPAQGFLGTRTLAGSAIATSSPGALRLGPETHILSPEGQRALWSTVSIEARDATTADALSTAAVFMDLPRLARLKRDADLQRITAVEPDGRLFTL